jgi:hypothetical protein
MPDPHAQDVFDDSIIRRGGEPVGAAVAHQWEFAGLGAGKLSLLFPAVDEIFPGAFPGPAQLFGDCVGCAASDACLSTIAQEIASGEPDPLTGIVEGPPEVPPLGLKDGVIARESIFGWRGWTDERGRGQSGDGWNCPSAAIAVTRFGFLLRKPYPEFKLDLTEYTEDTIRIGGGRRPHWEAESKKHVIRTATNLKGREEVRDFIAAGYAVQNCSSMGFSSTRDENGFSRQVGRWAHSQSFQGYDDRPEIHKLYGQGLVLWKNQWGRWNSGPRTILGTNIQIPEGCFWALASTIDRCQCIAYSSAAGWPRRKRTTFGATGRR